MNMIQDLVDRYFAMWNESDGKRRRDLIAQTWTEDASYVDPVVQGDGLAGIDAMVAAVQERFPGHKFRLSGDIDTHHDRVRFAWEFAADGAEPLVKGIDFAVVASDRLKSVTGFFTQIPAAA